MRTINHKKTLHPKRKLKVVPNIKVSRLICLMVAIALFGVFSASNSYVHATEVQKTGDITIPEDPTQSIKYWKPQVIAIGQDSQVDLAHEVFDLLLRAWDVSRVEPHLNVVQSTSGPWAASLSDGNILLSKEAIDVCFKYGAEKGRDMLAFVLAHELSHQKASDLWHIKFFRLVGADTGKGKVELSKTLSINELNAEMIQEAEAQADHDAIIMMATLGFNPNHIVAHDHAEEPSSGDGDFFTYWVEQIWKDSCAEGSSIKACRKAETRALRTRTQLSSVANQSVLYELGVQALVAGNYSEARRYFLSYGHSFPSRAVHSGIGVSYLAEALRIRDQNLAVFDAPAIYFPIFIDKKSGWQNVAAKGNLHRGSAEKISKKIQGKAQRAINYFEKAQRLAPDHQGTAFLLATSYLLMDNSAMAEGIIRGQYQRKFGEDFPSRYLLAMSDLNRKNYSQAEKKFKALISEYSNTLAEKESVLGHIGDNGVLNQQQMLYAVYMNYASLKKYEGKTQEHLVLWKEYAQLMSRKGNSMMLQIAVQKLNRANLLPRLRDQPLVNGFRLGDAQASAEASMDFMLEGEPLQHYQENGTNIVADDQSKIIALWQKNSSNKAVNIAGIRLGDEQGRAIKVLGSPSRQFDLIGGQYWAYDDYGLAFWMENGEVSGWFLYDQKEINS